MNAFHSFRPWPMLCLCVLAAGCFAQGDPVGYDLDKPARHFDLPPELREISALTDIDSITVASVQDEDGSIFFIDLFSGKVTRKVSFAGPGDYEGLTRIGDELFVLRSDGLIYTLEMATEDLALLDTFRVEVPHRDLESLGYDVIDQVLLIAAKDNLKGGPDLRDQRIIYGWDLRAHRLLSQPVLILSVNDIIKKAEKKGVTFDTRTNRHGVERIDFKLRPSSVATHPEDGTYWILSAKDHALLIVDRKGEFMALHLLDPALFPKAEGITFMANGDLLISNEGKEGQGNLLFFPRRK